MIKIIFFILLLLPNLCFADAALMGEVSAAQPSGGGEGGAPESYIAEETFEASEYDLGTCGTAFCWTETVTPDGDTATAGLDMDDSYCLALDPADKDRITTNGHAELWVSFKFRYDGDLESDETIFLLQNSGSFAVADIQLRSAANSRALRIRAVNGSYATSENLSPNSSTYILIGYNVSTDTATLKTWNGSAWTTGSTSVGSGGSNVQYVKPQNNADTEIFYLDTVKLKESSIDDPT